MILSAEISRRLDELAVTGNRLLDRRDYSGARYAWQQAMDLLPEPKRDWEASTWLYASIGDSFYHEQKFRDAKDALEDSLNCPDGHANPFILYRLGQTLVRLREEKEGIEFLLRAYMLDGQDIFASDDEGNEFLNLLRREKLIR